MQTEQTEPVDKNSRPARAERVRERVSQLASMVSDTDRKVIRAIVKSIRNDLSHLAKE